jgi:hypothetical protein
MRQEAGKVNEGQPETQVVKTGKVFNPYNRVQLSPKLEAMADAIMDKPAVKDRGSVAPKEAIKEEVKKEEVKPEVKKEDLKKIFSDAMGIKQSSEVSTDLSGEPLTAREKELADKVKAFELDKATTMEAETIETYLSKLDPAERALIEEDVYAKIPTKSYAAQIAEGVPVEERVANLITSARGLNADKLRELVKNETEEGKANRKVYEGLVSGVTSKGGKTREVDPAKVKEELRVRARAGDRFAQNALTAMSMQNNPHIQEIYKKLGIDA